MPINILVESSFKDSIWCRQLLRSLSEEAAAKRYETNILSSECFTDIDYDRLFRNNDERRLLFCICSSIKAASHLNEIVASKNIHLILLNHFFSSRLENYSSISMDFSGAVKKLVRYLISAGRRRIALYGINPNSSTDLIKKINFGNYMKMLDVGYDEGSVFYNNASLDDCFRAFYPQSDGYDAVICANDVVAISLLNKLKTVGVKVPEQFYVASFGDTVLSKIYAPSLTNVSVNLWEIGRQAVYLYSFLRKREPYVSASIMVHSELFVRDSTAHAPVGSEQPVLSRPLPEQEAETEVQTDTDLSLLADKYSFYHNINFYDDPCAAEILKVEDMLYCLNEFDFGILSSLLRDEPIASIAEKFYTSQQSISYRIKRMCQIIGYQSKTQMLDILRKYVTYDAIKAYKPDAGYRI